MSGCYPLQMVSLLAKAEEEERNTVVRETHKAASVLRQSVIPDLSFHCSGVQIWGKSHGALDAPRGVVAFAERRGLWGSSSRGVVCGVVIPVKFIRAPAYCKLSVLKRVLLCLSLFYLLGCESAAILLILGGLPYDPGGRCD